MIIKNLLFWIQWYIDISNTKFRQRSDHPKSLKDSSSNSQALRIKTICSTILNSIKTVRSLQKDSRKEVNREFAK